MQTREKHYNKFCLIGMLNPGWFEQILYFIVQNPEFIRLLPIVAMDEYPSGFNANPNENSDDVPLNVFEIVIYGLAYAYSNEKVGKEQYDLLVNHFRTHSICENMKLPHSVDNHKRQIYVNLINTLLYHNIELQELTYSNEHISVLESVQGMTESTITLLHLLYDPDLNSDRCIPYNDKQFKRGMSMFYQLEHITTDNLKEITKNWNNKKVGMMFIVQYAHYSDSIE